MSHGIVGLERALGVKLFVREPGRLALTRAGAEYLTYVSEALSLILIGTRRLPAPRSGRILAISCAPTLATRWLLPRLPGFRSRHPQIAIRIDTSHRQVGFPIDGYDFALRLGRVPTPRQRSIRLFDDWLLPVCSPAYRDAVTGRDGAVDLRRATTIHVTSATEDWQAWSDATGTAELSSADTLHVDTFAMALQAAAAGLGVALGRGALMDRELRDGTLVGVGPAVAAATSHWLVSAEGDDDRQDPDQFRTWLLAEARRFATEQKARFPTGAA